ncbi:hypothetical protein HYPSUDRAFT_48660 [Hypholoma sublateritium FD-334 SS-4]|uniref:Uncharacterized protein n=1 Tax=Hypholoma sublateritium (strain FD-334 SS-4) TaxID=945553 RepID=A0A0D2NEP6_HYPSF|nr:hypothetical protein HYPSUDRAFT_48660 [Hypholoma sublateritium FD-334 SS-4]
MVAFFYISTFTAPLQELNFTPTQNTRFSGSSVPYSSLLNHPVWGVTFGRRVAGDLNSTGAVKVIPLWDDDSPDKPDCTMYLPDEGSIHCPSRPLPGNNSYGFFDSPESFYNLYQPDLLVTVDFNILMVSSDSLIDFASNSVQVMVRMTNNTVDVLKLTRPTVLVPGVNMMGVVSMEIHQTFKNRGFATLGIFESLQSTLVGQVSQLYPDPSISPLIQRGTNISTLRLSVVREDTQWIVIRDIKNNSFIGGFSKVGGLWTFLSGIFAAIFGSSLMRILFGIKPISVFGFAHRWERDTIGKAYRVRYPALQQEMGADSVEPYRSGLLCLIRDEIVDLDLIQADESNESTLHAPQDEEEIPLQRRQNSSAMSVGKSLAYQ